MLAESGKFPAALMVVLAQGLKDCGNTWPNRLCLGEGKRWAKNFPKNFLLNFRMKRMTGLTSGSSKFM